MCGLAGFFGRSKNKDLSFSIITNLLSESEHRGIDASGFWASECGQQGRIFYDKLPLRPSEYISCSSWKELAKPDLDLVLAHARGASKGVGEPKFNQNNHPFVSEDKMLAIIHNGRIHDCEYNLLKKRYELESDCDSEIILKIIEDFDHGEASCDTKRIFGIKQVFDLLEESQMAVAVGERLENFKSLWLFRNKHRPLWIFDLSKDLGQIFFVSEKEIWEKAMIAMDCNLEYFCHELPVHEIWNFKKHVEENNFETKKIQISDLSSQAHAIFNPAKKKNTQNLCQIVSNINL